MAASKSAEWAEFYAQVNGAALARYPGLLQAWFPAGHLAGSEFECGNLNGSAGKSFKVNVNTGRWADFAANESGGDPIDLYAAANHLKNGDAALALGRELGITPPRLKRAPDNAWKPITPIPDGIKPERLPAGQPAGTHGAAWLYFDAQGRPIMYRVRFDLDGGGKEVLPLTWCENRETGERAWRWRDLPAPRPLYNVEKLSDLQANILIVEGEKCVDAAEELLKMPDVHTGKVGDSGSMPDQYGSREADAVRLMDRTPTAWIVVTWPGGAKRAGRKDTDWTPLKGRKVWIWPDNDEPGREAAVTIAEILAADKPKIIKPDENWPKGHDIADLRKAGWDNVRTLEFIERHAMPFDAGLKEMRVAVTEDRSAAQGDIFVSDYFLAKYRDDVRYCPTRGWLIWDGQRWALDETERIVTMAEQRIRDLYREAADINDDKERYLAVTFATKHSRIDRIRGALSLARAHVAVIQDDLDKDGYLLNCRNGTIDLRNGSLLPHERGDLITKLVELDYLGEESKAPRFERFLLEIFNGNLTLIDYLQRAVGYSFSADLSEQCLHFLHGAGANGKSTLIDTLLKVAGSYGQTAPAQVLLLQRYGTPIPTDIARMCGARFIAISETGEARALDEATVKTLTSVEPISARFLHRDSFEFTPTHHLWLSSNHKPNVGGTDLGIWRRIRLIPFEQTFPLNNSLADELGRELSGVLSWIVRGAVEWFTEGGLNPPEEVTTATAQYRSEQDVLDEFLEERCLLGVDFDVASRALYDDYHKWAKESGEYIWSKKLFGRRLASRGFLPIRGTGLDSGERRWRGLRLK